MKANELRLGNLLFDEKSNQIFEVQFSDLIAMQNGEIDYYRSIKITKEIVMNLGFAKHVKFKNTYCKGVFSVKFADSGLIYFKYNDFVVAELFYIHELQNLYFLLTKREELVFSSTEP